MYRIELPPDHEWLPPGVSTIDVALEGGDLIATCAMASGHVNQWCLAWDLGVARKELAAWLFASGFGEPEATLAADWLLDRVHD